MTDEHAGQRDGAGQKLPSEEKTAVGMIPLPEEVLRMFLETGWGWGGDYGTSKKGRKDYMHFEDDEALDKLKLDDPDKKD